MTALDGNLLLFHSIYWSQRSRVSRNCSTFQSSKEKKPEDSMTGKSHSCRFFRDVTLQPEKPRCKALVGCGHT